ncbi:MAG: hypothetical protein D6714_07355 [Bacteroidetes bacterium]|nr:MAG: hypothetical protein D6714_07355 [Bacteroidota bacterium]
MKKLFTFLGFALFAGILAGCVTQKKKGEDMGPVKKLYHNITAEYNGYFNADLLLQKSIADLNEQHIDNYNQILPVYEYVAADNPQAVAGQLDEAIKKVSVVVNLHPYSDWADDCYLLMGKAQYLKKDYEGAEETLEYAVEEYSPRAMAKKKAMAKKGTSKKSGKASKAAKAKSKKQRQKAAKKKKKAREKERKRRNKEIKKKRKKGKSSSASRTKKTPKEDEPKKNEETKPEPAEELTPSRVTLGNLETTTTPDGKPENYFLKHRPAYQEATLWLARTYIERENYTQAERILSQLEESGGTQPDIRAQLYPVKAHFYIKRKKYDQAIPALEEAIELTKDRTEKARYAFILGQIYQMKGLSDKAYDAFARVIKFGPNYEMTFNAKLAVAQNAWLTGKGTAEDALKNLEKMLKDFKNVDYQDRIYFAMAQIELQRDHRDNAIVYLKKSAWYNIGNDIQKAESYYQLATLFYETEDYVDAKYYFDSTLNIMDKKDERYEPALKLRDNLLDIARNIEVIELQDSLLRIAQMTEDEQKILAAKIIARKAEEERARIQLEATKARQRELAQGGKGAPGGGLAGANPPGGSAQSASSFWAFDDRKVKRGLRDFQRVWGSRPLEDNWRRSSQQTFADNGEPVAAAEIAQAAVSDEDLKSIFKDVPKNEADVKAAHRAIESAMYSLGTLYRIRLQHNQKCVEVLEELLRRYPDTQYKLDALYFLYLAYTDLGDTAKAEMYKRKIIEEYPTSTYAKVLLDPGYVKTLLNDEQKLNKFYDEAYAQFTSGNYQQAFDRIGQVGQKFGALNKLQPRFELLKALCIGNLKGKEAYIEALKEVIGKYPDSPEATRAKEILRLLDAKQASQPGQNRPNQNAEDSKFKFEEDVLHYVIVVFDEDVNLNDAKVAVSNYNREYHKLDRLRISNIYLGNLENKIPIIVIRRFKDMNKAMDYFDSVQKNADDFLPGMKYRIFPVTQNNYRQILRSKSLEGYQAFFEANYLN